MRDDMASIKEAATVLGHLGGLKGGPARAKALSAPERSSIAALGWKAKAHAHNLHKRSHKFRAR